MTDSKTTRLMALEREAEKLRKINAALMSRVERSTDQQLNAFSLFETAIALDQQVRDRTQQLKQALQSLEKTNGRLLQAKQQAEAASSLKSSVLVSVTHDLLQPLNAARLTLSALAEMANEPKGVALTEQIDRSLATLEDMLRTLLDISKLDAGVLRPEFGPVAIGSLFEALEQEFAASAARRNLGFRIMPSSAVVRSDPLMLRRILQNFLANALRYTHRGSVLMGCRLHGDDIRIEVHDTGPGIPEAQREAIFVEFQRGETSAGDKAGIGLGLSIVRRFADLLEHDIRLTSRPGKGAVFAVTVPRTLDAVAIPVREQASVDYRYGGMEGAKILLIENDLSSAEGLGSPAGEMGLRRCGDDLQERGARTHPRARRHSRRHHRRPSSRQWRDRNPGGRRDPRRDQHQGSGDHRHRRLLRQGRLRRLGVRPRTAEEADQACRDALTAVFPARCGAIRPAMTRRRAAALMSPARGPACRSRASTAR
jgi:signal transduction histidine kinase